MQVRDVLIAKGGRVVATGPEATVADAIATLVSHNIGSLPIVDAQGYLLGIFSERDILRGLHLQGEAFRSVKVADVMTRDPIFCEPCDDVEEVMAKMSERHVAKVPVLDGDRLVGVVSVGDVIKLMAERLKAENTHLISYLYGNT